MRSAKQSMSSGPTTPRLSRLTRLGLPTRKPGSGRTVWYRIAWESEGLLSKMNGLLLDLDFRFDRGTLVQPISGHTLNLRVPYEEPRQNG
jgi:hypothetical protein